MVVVVVFILSGRCIFGRWIILLSVFMDRAEKIFFAIINGYTLKKTSF